LEDFSSNLFHLHFCSFRCQTMFLKLRDSLLSFLPSHLGLGVASTIASWLPIRIWTVSEKQGIWSHQSRFPTLRLHTSLITLSPMRIIKLKVFDERKFYHWLLPSWMLSCLRWERWRFVLDEQVSPPKGRRDIKLAGIFNNEVC
jgi:hypothetical protein